MSDIMNLCDDELRSQIKKCAAISLKKCKTMVKLKKAGEKELKNFKKIYTEKNKKAGKAGKTDLREKLKEGCDNVYDTASEVFNTGNRVPTYSDNIFSILCVEKDAIYCGSNILSNDKKLITSLNKIKKYHDSLIQYNLEKTSLIAKTLNNLNPKLDTGLKSLEKFNSIDYKKLPLEDLYKTYENATSIMEKVKEHKESIENSNSVTAKISKDIFKNYSDTRSFAKIIINSYSKIEKSLKAIKEKNQKACENMKFEDLIKKEDISGFTTNIKKIKAVVKNLAEGFTRDFDIRSLKSVKNFPKKAIRQILSLINESEKFDIEGLKSAIDKIIGQNKIKSINTKLDNIKISYENYKCDKKTYTDIKSLEEKAKTYLKPQQSNNIQILLDKIRDNGLVKENIIHSDVDEAVKNTTVIEDVLTDIEKEAGKNNIYHLILIKSLSEELFKYMNKLKGDFDNLYGICQDMEKALTSSKFSAKTILGKVQPITGVIATIGCFAGFAMSSICPAVGWVVFGVCIAAFAINIGTAIYKSVTNNK